MYASCTTQVFDSCLGVQAASQMRREENDAKSMCSVTVMQAMQDVGKAYTTTPRTTPSTTTSRYGSSDKEVNTLLLGALMIYMK